MGKLIAVTGKGGVGKTTAVANLAVALALDGMKVACVDGDIGLRNLDVVMGLENRIVYDIVDVVEGRCKLRQALIKDKRLPELCLLPAAQTRDKSAVKPDDLGKGRSTPGCHFGKFRIANVLCLYGDNIPDNLVDAGIYLLHANPPVFVRAETP